MQTECVAPATSVAVAHTHTSIRIHIHKLHSWVVLLTINSIRDIAADEVIVKRDGKKLLVADTIYASVEYRPLNSSHRKMVCCCWKN